MKAVIFDLDGTLTDSAPIITEVIADTVRQAGVDNPPEFYRKFVGPPLPWTFKQLGVPSDEVDWYVEDYRKRYHEAFPRTQIFPGVLDLLDGLGRRGIGRALATSKLHNVTLEVVKTLGLDTHLDVVCGAAPEEEKAGKGPVVRSAIEQLKDGGWITQGADDGDLASPRTDLLMVGDRIYDVEGAGQYGVRTVLVTWGESWPNEQEAAWKVVGTPAELEALLA